MEDQNAGTEQEWLALMHGRDNPQTCTNWFLNIPIPELIAIDPVEATTAATGTNEAGDKIIEEIPHPGKCISHLLFALVSIRFTLVLEQI